MHHHEHNRRQTRCSASSPLPVLESATRENLPNESDLEAAAKRFIRQRATKENEPRELHGTSGHKTPRFVNSILVCSSNSSKRASAQQVRSETNGQQVDDYVKMKVIQVEEVKEVEEFGQRQSDANEMRLRNSLARQAATSCNQRDNTELNERGGRSFQSSKSSKSFQSFKRVQVNRRSSRRLFSAEEVEEGREEAGNTESESQIALDSLLLTNCQAQDNNSGSSSKFNCCHRVNNNTTTTTTSKKTKKRQNLGGSKCQTSLEQGHSSSACNTTTIGHAGGERVHFKLDGLELRGRASEINQLPIKMSSPSSASASASLSSLTSSIGRHQACRVALKLLPWTQTVGLSSSYLASKQRSPPPPPLARKLLPLNSTILFTLFSINCLLVALLNNNYTNSALVSAATAPAPTAPTAPTAAALAAATSSSNLKQYIRDQPEAQYFVPLGQDVSFPCWILNRQGECAWLRNGRIVAPIQRKYSFAKAPDSGDCSLTIRNASNSLDDGQWQCQVLSPDPEQEPLQTRYVGLTVLVPPERPQIKNASHGHAKLILEENRPKIVTCEIRGGNPAPQIEWYLDGKSVTKDAQIASIDGVGGGGGGGGGQQAAATRITQSKLKISDTKRSMNGKNLTCVGVHQTLNQSTLVELDVQYVPTVSVAQREYSIVEGSPLSISCQVDSNPAPTSINWRRVNDGSQQQQQAVASSGSRLGRLPMVSDKEATVLVHKGSMLNFEDIRRTYNQNSFECLAVNSLGTSTPVEVKLNVLYAPTLLNTSHSESVELDREARLECIFDANPAPEIKWFYTDPLSRSESAMLIDQSNQLLSNANAKQKQQQQQQQQQLLQDQQQVLIIRNATYRNEGEYHCEARNSINGQANAVRSSNIGLDIYGQPQILPKSPLHAKAVQGTKSDISLTFCSDPQPTRVYWQFGSIRLDVRTNSFNNNNNNGHQTTMVPPPGGGALTASQAAHSGARHSGQSPPPAQPLLLSSVMQRFQVHPLQPLQKRDSSFSKTPTCFEAQLSLLDPELSDQRDYNLIVHNERGSATGSVRLRVTSPLSPALMITSAFVFICGLFLCSLLFLFVLKKRQQFMAAGSGSGTTTTTSSCQLNGGTTSSSASANGQQQQQARRSASGRTKNGMAKDLTLINGGKQQQQQQQHHHQAQNNNSNQQQQAANGGGGGGLLKMATNGLQQHQQQTNGIVNGAGNGLANGAGNPLGHANQMTLEDEHVSKQAIAGLHGLMSLASSDTSCNDQRQLLANCGSDRNSSASSSGGGGGSGCGGGESGATLGHDDYVVVRRSKRLTGATNASAHSDRSSASSTPSTPMNHISVDDELHLNGSYQATESVTLGAQLSPNNLDMSQLAGGNISSGAAAASGGLIYANIDYASASRHNIGGNGAADNSNTSSSNNNNNNNCSDSTLDTCSNDSLLLNNHNHNHSTMHQHAISKYNDQAGTGGVGDTRSLARSKVGATIAMMNSLAAAAAAAAAASPPPTTQQQQQQQQQLNGYGGPESTGALSDAINQQLAANSTRQSRRPGPPKPPKPSIQLRSRFYQQVQQANSNGGGVDLTPAGNHALSALSPSASLASPRPPQATGTADQHHKQQQQQQQLVANQTGDTDLAAEYSRFAFPARAEL